jgi:hypothetical protein
MKMLYEVANERKYVKLGLKIYMISKRRQDKKLSLKAVKMKERLQW